MEFFRKVKSEGLEADIVAFGMTKRASAPVEEDENLASLLDSGTEYVTIFGKTWLLHVEKVLNTTRAENLNMIYESVKFLRERGRQVIYDAEHFFDGYRDNSEYALATLKRAVDAGASRIVLCDTRGGSLPADVYQVTRQVKQHFSIPIGIHAHNDRGLATANSLFAITAGAEHVQGTVNGIGERCGNANLVEIIGNLETLGVRTGLKTTKLAAVASYVFDMAGMRSNDYQPFVGKYAFTHKGGVHGHAVAKVAESYEHIKPERFGNIRRITASSQAGRASILSMGKSLGFELRSDDPRILKILAAVKRFEAAGHVLENASGTLSLIYARNLGQKAEFIDLLDWKVDVVGQNRKSKAECSLKVKIGKRAMTKKASGNGPVNAFDSALRKALTATYPELEKVRLTGYRVKELDAESGTAAKVAVYVDYKGNGKHWTTVSVSTNILDASVRALVQGYDYYLWRRKYLEPELKTNKNSAAK